MKPYYQDESVTIWHGDGREFEGKADVIMTDPPYDLGFMNKPWDRLGESYEWHKAWASVLDAGWLFAFGGTRTWHRLACAIEDSGWQIRDTMMWLYGQGFPKGKNNLKPAWEPIIVARKYGDLDIEAGRIPTTEPLEVGRSGRAMGHAIFDISSNIPRTYQSQGRWPANLILECTCEGERHTDTDCPCRLLDEQSGERQQGHFPKAIKHARIFRGNQEQEERFMDSGGASRFFYCAKASRAERNAGCEGMVNGPEAHNLSSNACSRCGLRVKANGSGQKCECGDLRETVKLSKGGNDHPTVKPLKLMEYLVKLSGGQTILDPFMGSGTTLVAAKRLGRKAIGIEIDEHSCEIAAKRCQAVLL